MRASIYKKISKGAMRGRIAQKIYDPLPLSFFQDPVSAAQEMRGEVIKDSRWRWAVLFSLPNGERIFLKRDKTKDWVESLKYLLLPSRGKKEWFLSCRLRSENLNIPEPLGWLEKGVGGFLKESYFLSEAIGSGVSFIEDAARAKAHSSIIELAKFLRKIHESGLLHQDLHAGNFLWNGDALFLTDLHSAKILKTLSLNQRLWNLSQLFHSLRSSWGERERILFVEKYFEGDPVYSQDKERLFQKIQAFMDRLQKRQWQSRTKRCLKESTEFTVQREKGVRTLRRRDFPMDRIQRVIAKHQTLLKEKPFLLVKHAPEVAVSILDDDKGKICVKQFRYPHVLGRMKEYFRRSKGFKSWIGANGLRARGIPSIKTLAMVERKDWLGRKESFLLMETSVENQEMDRYILRGFKDLGEKMLFVKSFARWLSGFHKMNLYHKDMKTCNIVVIEQEGTWNFHLLDMEDILLDEEVDSKKLFQNCLQLHTSTPKVMTRTDRLRFYNEYVRLNPVVRNGKVFLRRLMEESQRRNLVYVSSRGVVVERM